MSQLLHRLGLSPNAVGFWYILSAIEVMRQDTRAVSCLTKRVYTAVAETYSVSSGAVESGLRHAVSACWKGNRSLLEEVVGVTLPARPTVGRFLAALLMHLETDGSF